MPTEQKPPHGQPGITPDVVAELVAKQKSSQPINRIEHAEGGTRCGVKGQKSRRGSLRAIYHQAEEAALARALHEPLRKQPPARAPDLPRMPPPKSGGRFLAGVAPAATSTSAAIPSAAAPERTPKELNLRLPRQSPVYVPVLTPSEVDSDASDDETEDYSPAGSLRGASGSVAAAPPRTREAQLQLEASLAELQLPELRSLLRSPGLAILLHGRKGASLHNVSLVTVGGAPLPSGNAIESAAFAWAKKGMMGLGGRRLFNLRDLTDVVEDYVNPLKFKLLERNGVELAFEACEPRHKDVLVTGLRTVLARVVQTALPRAPMDRAALMEDQERLRRQGSMESFAGGMALGDAGDAHGHGHRHGLHHGQSHGHFDNHGHNQHHGHTKGCSQGDGPSTSREADPAPNGHQLTLQDMGAAKSFTFAQALAPQGSPKLPSSRPEVAAFTAAVACRSPTRGNQVRDEEATAERACAFREERHAELQGDVEEVLDAYDTYGEGNVDPEDLGRVLGFLGVDLSPTAASRLLLETGFTTYGRVPYRDGLAANIAGCLLDAEESRLWRMFDGAGGAATGFLSAVEVRTALILDGRFHSTADVERRMASVVETADGRVDFGEFTALMIQLEDLDAEQ